MSVQVPLTEKTGAAAIAARITSLAAVPTTAPHYQQSQQLLLQTQIELVNALVSQNKLSAASILSTVSYRGTLPVLSAITALNTNIAAWATSNPALVVPANVTLAQLQAQAVAELMASGQMSPALVLSTMSYIGGGAQ